jgi:hypothetical protein
MYVQPLEIILVAIDLIHSTMHLTHIVNGSVSSVLSGRALYNPFFHSTKSDLSPTLAYSP